MNHRSVDRHANFSRPSRSLGGLAKNLSRLVVWSTVGLVSMSLAACGDSSTSDSGDRNGVGGSAGSGGTSGSGGSAVSAGSGGASGSNGGAGTAGSGMTAGSSGSSGAGGASGADGSSSSDGSGGVAGSGTDASAGMGGSSAVDGSADTGGGGGTGDSGMTCPLPTTFKWSSTGPLASPKSPSGHNFVSLKDFTCVHWNNLFHVYATVYDQSVSGWNMVYFNFSDWSQAAAASQFYMQNSPTHGGVAPQLFYFTPKKKWVLVYQWGASFSTSDDPGQPQNWSAPSSLLTGGPSGGIDYSVICNSQNCYLIFAGDNGKLYQSKMPIGQFPSAFNGYTTILSDSTNNLFESPRVYSIAGTNQYLLIVEAIGSGGRYFRSWSATDLEGPWTPLAATEQKPFAGKANVTFAGNAWTNDISHGDMVRYDPAETMPVDACNLQFVYQGFDKTVQSSNYGLIPYRMALLTLTP